MMDAAEIHAWVAEYNWDDGFEAIWPIVDDRETEFATALLIYWRLEGPWFDNGLPGNAEAKRLHDLVADRLLVGYYAKKAIRYDPVQDHHLSRTQLYKLRKAGVPEELIQPDYSSLGDP